MATTTLTFAKGMNTDLAYPLRDGSSYLRAENLTFTSRGDNRSGILSTVKGNTLLSSLDLQGQDIVGYANLLNSLILFTESAGVSYIYEITDLESATPQLRLVYSDNGSSTSLGFNTSYPITAVTNKESENIRKVYWVDGLNELRYLNLDEDYQGADASIFNMVPNNLLNLPLDTSILEGGNYKAGVVQHAYQFFKNNGADSTISQLSLPIKLSIAADERDGGNDINESVQKSIQVVLSDIPQQITDIYDRVRIYAVFYDTLTSAPKVNVVNDFEITGNSITIIDTGDYIDVIDLEEFINYKETSYTANTIESKNEHLFLGNVKENTFNSTALDNWDSRAYRFNEAGTQAEIFDLDNPISSLVAGENHAVTDPYKLVGTTDDVPESHDCINRYNDIYTRSLSARLGANNYRFIGSGTTLGGEGINIRYTFETHSKAIDTYAAVSTAAESNQSKNVRQPKSDLYTSTTTETRELVECQTGEVYRIGIKFFNKKGQSSFVKWIGDVLWEEEMTFSATDYTNGLNRKVLYDSTSKSIINQTAVLKVEIKNFPSDPNIASWQLVRVKRDSKDKSIVMSGLASNTVYNTIDSSTNVYRPYWHVNSDTGGSKYETMIDLQNLNDNTLADSRSTINQNMLQFISPEAMFNNPSKKDISNYKLNLFNVVSDIQVDSGVSTHPFGTVKLRELRSRENTGTGGNQDIDGFAYVSPQHAQDNKGELYANVGSERYLNQVRIAEGNDDAYAGSNSGLIIRTENALTANIADAVEGRYFYAYLVQNVDISRYGGITYEARFNNTYIPFSKVHPITDTVAFGTYGDVWTTMFYFMHYLLQDKADDTKESGQELITFPVQSTIDTRYRNDLIFDYMIDQNTFQSLTKSMFVQETVEEGIAEQPGVYDEEIGDLYTYNPVYSKIGDSRVSIPKPFDFIQSDYIGTKVINSEKKLNGEKIDKWLMFKPANFIELNSSYGDISKLKTVENGLYFWQESSFGKLAVNDRYIIGEGAGQLALGTGGVLERYDYISTDIGCSSKFATTNTDSSIYWYDSRKNRIYSYSQGIVDLTTVKGITKYLDSKTPINDAHFIRDDINSELLLSVGNEVLVFDLLTNTFTGVYTYSPYILIPMYNGNYLSSSSGNELYRHNDNTVNRAYFYGSNNKSTIKHIATENYPVTKVFDLLSWTSASEDTNNVNQFEDTFDRYRVYTDYQNTDWQNITWKRKERTFTTTIPRDRVNAPQSANVNIFDPGSLDATQLYKRRIRDKFVIIDMEYDNSTGNQFSFPFINAIYRESIR